MPQPTRQETARHKQAINAATARRHRSDVRVSVRKDKREQLLAKKRREAGTPAHAPAKQEAGGLAADAAEAASAAQLGELPAWTQLLLSDDEPAVLRAAGWFRKLLSHRHDPPIDRVLEAPGLVGRLVQLMTCETNPDLQLECAWSITNIASGSAAQTRAVVEHQAVPVLGQLLSAAAAPVREQAVWALGNIAGDSPGCRDLCLSTSNLLAGLMQQVHAGSEVSMVRTVAWAVSNLCRGKPRPDFAAVQAALPCLAVLLSSDDTEILTDACWALSHLSDGDDARIQAVVNAEVVPRMVVLLGHPDASVRTPAVRCVGNIVSGNAAQTDAVLACGALAQMHALLGDASKSLRKESCWALSNVMAGTRAQVAAVFESGLVGDLLADLLSNDDFDVKKEAAWCVSNAAVGGDGAQAERLVESGAVAAMCELLSCQDAAVCQLAVEAVANVLSTGERMGQEVLDRHCQAVEEAGGLDALEELQSHANDAIYKKAVHILERFFAEDDEAGDTAGGMAPAAGPDGFWAFGLQQPPLGGGGGGQAPAMVC